MAVGKVRPLEGAPGIVYHQSRLPGCIGIAASERVIIGREGLYRLESRLRQRLRRRHARALIVGFSGTYHGCRTLAN